jgi:hypothetical protein
MTTLFENEHPLVTPNFIGTDQEKIAVLGYWSSLISLLRAMNSIVISHDNKLAIISQLQSELALIDNEINNDSARPVIQADGGTEMTNVPRGQTDGETPAIVDLSDPNPATDVKTPTDVTTVTDPYSQFNRRNVPVGEAMQRLAGNYYSKKK